MLEYSLGDGVAALSTEKGEEVALGVMLPLHQAHGVKSAIVTSATVDEEVTGVDALITRERGFRIGVKTADCVPILVHDISNATVAAIHSGWRGTVADICGTVIGRMVRELGCDPRSMRAVVGPCIHVEAFEVGDEVGDAFVAAGWSDCCHRMPRWDGGGEVKCHVDLPGVVRRQLVNAGVPAQNIEVRSECTFMSHERFYSARRLGPTFDRQRIISAIKLV